MLYMGIDLGKKKSQVAMLDEKGEVKSEFKMVNSKEGFVRFIKKLKEPVEAVCETGNKSFWLSDIMQELKIPMKFANAYKVKLIAQARVKTDKVDARVLAQLRRADFIPEVYVPSQDIRTWREMIRGRSHLVRIRTQLYNRIHAILDRYAIQYDGIKLRNETALAWIEMLELPKPIKFALDEYMNLISQINEHR